VRTCKGQRFCRFASAPIALGDSERNKRLPRKSISRRNSVPAFEGPNERSADTSTPPPLSFEERLHPSSQFRSRPKTLAGKWGEQLSPIKASSLHQSPKQLSCAQVPFDRTTFCAWPHVRARPRRENAAGPSSARSYGGSRPPRADEARCCGRRDNCD
jgi:hypothetical protein